MSPSRKPVVVLQIPDIVDFHNADISKTCLCGLKKKEQMDGFMKKTCCYKIYKQNYGERNKSNDFEID